MKNVFVAFLLILITAGFQPLRAQLIDNGDGTISDVDQQIMWTKDAGMASSMLYTEAGAWIVQLNADAHLGYSDWRLPSGIDVRSDATATSEDGQYYYNATGSELGFLFYNHLGGTAGCHVLKTGDNLGVGCSFPNPDPDLLLFDNIPPEGNFNNTVYWTQMESANSPGFNWTFAFGSGVYREQPLGDPRRFRGWAVRDASIATPQCNDGIDNDGDGRIDAEDPGCASTADDDESDDPVAQCMDGIDNDDDGLVDLDDPNCCGELDNDELAHFESGSAEIPQCRDAVDNDDDCQIDYPDDALCARADDPSESLRCRRFFFDGWLCLARAVWWVGYISVALLATFAGFGFYRARKRGKQET